MKNKIISISLLLLLLFSQQLFAQWQPTSGPNPQNVNSILVSPDGYLYAITGDSSLNLKMAYSSNYGATWSNLNSTINKSYKSICAKGTSVYALNDTMIFRSSNHGLNWIPTNPNLQQYVNSYLNNISVTAPYFYLCTSTGLFYSYDNAISWFKINTSWSANTISYAVQHDTIFVGTSNNGIYSTVNGGSTWSNYYFSFFENVHSIIIFHNKVFAATNSGLFYSTNNGTTWQLSNLTSGNISSFCTKGKDLFASVNDGGGVYKYNDTTLVWSPINTGLSNTEAYSLAASDTFLYVATSDHVWKRQFSDVIFYRLKLSLDPPNCATLNGSGIYPYHTPIHVEPIYDTLFYKFINWTRDGALFGVDSAFDLKIDDDFDLTAHFALINAVVDPIASNYIKAYPNPSQAYVSLKTIAALTGQQYFIYNSLGEIVLQGIINRDETTLDLNKIPVGCYFLRFKDEKWGTVKLMKE